MTSRSANVCAQTRAVPAGLGTDGKPEVIAGARFQLSKRPIDDALKGYSEDVRIVKAARSLARFEIIVDEQGFS